MADDRDPDFSEDTRGKQDVGQGYPETQQGSGDDAIEDGEYPDKSEHGGTPDTAGTPDGDDGDSGPSSATGNPRAAG